MKRVICGSYKPRRREQRVSSACAGGHVVYVTESTLTIRGHRGSTAYESVLVEGALLLIGKFAAASTSCLHVSLVVVVVDTIQSFALRSASGIRLKQQRMSTSASTVFNLGAIINPYSTNYERDRIGNLLFTILN